MVTHMHVSYKGTYFCALIQLSSLGGRGRCLVLLFLCPLLLPFFSLPLRSSPDCCGPCPLATSVPKHYTQVLDTNLVGPFLVAQAVARSMVREKRSGSIINISSVSSMVPSSGEMGCQAEVLSQLERFCVTNRVCRFRRLPSVLHTPVAECLY